MRIFAVAVMSNHLHIVVQQGDRPLAALMQPLLRRLALRVQAAHDLEGPVFWRPYGSQPCLDPHHARNAIAYTHLNPVRAGLCQEPGDYPWTSHGLYAGATEHSGHEQLRHLRPVLDAELALPLFAAGPRRSLSQLRADYAAFIDWRLQAEAAVEERDGQDPNVASPMPPPPWRGLHWAATLSPLFHSPAPGDTTGLYHRDRPGTGVPDLATLATATLAAEAPGVSIDAIRGRRGGARAARLRHAVIRRLHAAGYRNVEIARHIGLSESAVSYVLCRRIDHEAGAESSL